MPSPSPSPSPNPPALNPRIPIRILTLSSCSLFSNPTLSAPLTTLINTSYRHQTPLSPTRWSTSPSDKGTRLKTDTALCELLGEEGILCAVSVGASKGGWEGKGRDTDMRTVEGEKEEEEQSADLECEFESTSEELIACAAACVWKGGMDGVDSDGNSNGNEIMREQREEGEDEHEGLNWELVAVAMAPEARGGGVSRICVEALVKELVERERRRGRGTKTLKLWAQVVDEMNGGYWRRLGWEEVRSFEKEAGWWGSLQKFKMLIMMKEVRVDVLA